MRHEGLSAERVREVLEYNPDSGAFTWRVRSDVGKRWNTVWAGKPAGYQNTGYWLITIDNRRYKAHQLAWCHVYGKWPSNNIDHIDGNPLNNCIANLRLATQRQNLCNRRIQRNNASGYKGVWYHRIGKRWTAQIKANGKKIHLGMFDTPEQAHAAYSQAALLLHGQFARTT